jgi:ATP phosphoribosyltransferase
MSIRLAIQKSGRLTELSRKLIAECGIELEPSSAKLRAPAYNFPLEALFLRDDDIPGYVADGVADAAIVGENVVAERGAHVQIMRRLGFGKCRLAIALPKGAEYSGNGSLEGKTIATSYPRLLSRYLEEQGIGATIHEISGSVEIAPSLGLCDAICDLVSSGSTLLSNGLREVAVVFESQAVLIVNSSMSGDAARELDRLVFRIDAVLRAKRTKYILLNVLNEKIPDIVSLLPGLKSPSILPLATPGWSSLHTVVSEDDFWNVIERLRGAGAEGILVLPIEKVVA